MGAVSCCCSVSVVITNYARMTGVPVESIEMRNGGTICSMTIV
nr:MAG TPA: hypothetical protein [Herelleviridae sp.]